jgi:hypothetical protein
LYDATDEFGIHYSDPDLGIPWPVRQPLLSERDLRHPRLKDAFLTEARSIESFSAPQLRNEPAGR